MNLISRLLIVLMGSALLCAPCYGVSTYRFDDKGNIIEEKEGAAEAVCAGMGKSEEPHLMQVGAHPTYTAGGYPIQVIYMSDDGNVYRQTFYGGTHTMAFPGKRSDR